MTGDVSQIAAGTINATGLGLQVEGETVLNAANDIDVLAASNNGATQVTTANDLEVGTVTIEAVSAIARSAETASIVTEPTFMSSMSVI